MLALAKEKRNCLRFADDMYVLVNEIVTIKECYKTLEEGMDGYGMKKYRKTESDGKK